MAVAAVLSITSCEREYAYDHYNPTSVDGWDRTDTLYFTPGKLEAGLYEFNLGFRATEEYPYRELGLHIEWTVYPSKKQTTKEIRCNVFDSNGRIEGKQSISSSDFICPVGEITINRGDSLVIAVTHCMNRMTMPGLTSVGVQLKKQ